MVCSKNLFLGVWRNFGEKLFKNREFLDFAKEDFDFAFGLNSSKLHETPWYVVKAFF